VGVVANGTRRCAFKEGKRRCSRNGFGNPPLCRAHAIQVRLHGEQEEILEENPLYAFINIADRALSRSNSNFAKQAGTLFGEFLAASANKASAQRQYITPQYIPPPAPNDPLEILGFPAGSTPTKTQIKARQRELAQLFHPDKGGSLAAMQKVNDAVNALLSKT